MQLRVRSLDGAEIILEVPPLTVRVHVADIKRRSLVELLRMRATSTVVTATTEATEVDDDVDRRHRMTRSCLAFRGQLLADGDDVNLFALVPTDFFVLIEDYDDGEDEEEVKEDLEKGGDEETKSEEPKFKVKQPKKAVKKDTISRGQANTVVMQLVEMGFDMDQARHATALAHGELPRAIALLMGEVDASAMHTNPSHRNQLRGFVQQLICRYPEVAAIESLLRHEQVHTLKRIAMENDFEALVLLKETFPARWLAQMNENPATTALFLALPEQFENTGRGESISRGTSTKPVKRAKTTHDQIDLTSEPITSGERSLDQDAIDRLTAMGFASDLVAAIYESCGGNEQLAANLLFETLA